MPMNTPTVTSIMFLTVRHSVAQSTPSIWLFSQPEVLGAQSPLIQPQQ